MCLSLVSLVCCDCRPCFFSPVPFLSSFLVHSSPLCSLLFHSCLHFVYSILLFSLPPLSLCCTKVQGGGGVAGSLGGGSGSRGGRGNTKQPNKTKNNAKHYKSFFEPLVVIFATYTCLFLFSFFFQYRPLRFTRWTTVRQSQTTTTANPIW